MIDLAPHHKHGLVVSSPVLLAGGVLGAGDSLPPGLDATSLGAIVIGPLTERSRAGSATPRLAEFPGGFVLDAGGQNRGVDATLRHSQRMWPGLGCPIIIQLADHQPQALTASARRLAADPSIHGFELLLPINADNEVARGLVKTLVRASDLPVWVKLPLEAAPQLASSSVECGAVGLVVAQPPVGTVRRNATDGSVHWVTGSVFSAAVFPLVLRALRIVERMALPAALIAAGGLNNAEQVDQALAAGAQAVQIDSLVWAEPALVRMIGERGEAGAAADAHRAR